jgi:hypothetical protein
VKLQPGMTTLEPVVQCRSVVRYVGPRLLPISNRALSGTTAGLVSSGFFFFFNKFCSKPTMHRLPDGTEAFLSMVAMTPSCLWWGGMGDSCQGGYTDGIAGGWYAPIEQPKTGSCSQK